MIWPLGSWKLSYNIYLHDKNILEYAPLLVGSGKFIIFHIEVTLMHIFFWKLGMHKVKNGKICTHPQNRHFEILEKKNYGKFFFITH